MSRVRNSQVMRSLPWRTNHRLALPHVNPNDLKLATIGQRTRPSIRTRFFQWVESTLSHLDSADSDGCEIYMRWPGERLPKASETRRQWGMGQEDDTWVLAA